MVIYTVMLFYPEGILELTTETIKCAIIPFVMVFNNSNSGRKYRDDPKSVRAEEVRSTVLKPCLLNLLLMTISFLNPRQ